MQVDPLLHTVCETVCLVFLHEKFRSGKTKAVNTLLYIPYHEDIVSALRHSGHAGQDGLLHQVTVLIFINHDLLKPVLIFSCGRRRDQFPVFFYCKNRQRKLFHVAEVDHIPAPFLLGKQLCKTVHQPCKCPHRRTRPPHILLPFSARSVEIQFTDILYQLFRLFAQLFYRLLFLIGHSFILLPGQALPGKAADHVILGGKPFRPFQAFHILQIRLQHIPIHIRSIRLFADLKGMFQHPADVSRPAAYSLCRPMRHLPSLRRFICLHTGIQPSLRLRITPGILIELQDNLLNLTVISPGPEPFCKIKKLFCPFGIARFQQLIQHILPQKPELPLLRDTESGVNTNDMEMIPDHRETKAVDRRDRSTVDQGGLLLQSCVPRAFLKLLLDRCPNPLFHLCCRCLRKCYDEQPVHIYRMLFLCELLDDTFHKHCCLTGACRR